MKNNDYKRIAERWIASARVRVYIETKHLKKHPDVIIAEDGEAFFSDSKNQIHIGYLAPIKFDCDTEEMAVSCLDFLLEHELQHVLMTAADPYFWGIKRSAQVVLESLSNELEDKKRYFKSDSDYEYFCQSILPTYKIYINFNELMKICSMVMNAMEDGRIERARASKFPGFAKKRRVFNGLLWQKAELEDKTDQDALEKNPATMFGLLFNQILMLSVCQIYQKGFALNYVGTSIMEKVSAFLPHIGRGVMAKKTRDMAKESIEICRLLAPYISRMCMSQPTALIETLSRLIENNVDEIIEQANDLSQLSEKDELQCESGNSTFPTSDIIIPIDDDAYDRLVENLPKSADDGSGGLMICRKHPKEEDKNSEGEKSSSGSNHSVTSNDEKSDSGEISDAGGQGNTIECNTNTKPFEPESTGIDAASTEEEHVAGGNEKSQKQPGCSDSTDVADSANGSFESHGCRSSGGGDHSEEEILEAMRRAAEETREDAAEALSSINEVVRHESVPGSSAAIVHDSEAPLNPSDFKEQCENFIEHTRVYALDEDLPSVIKARGLALRKKNEKYFKTLKHSKITNIDKGVIDPSQVFNLALGDTNIFCKDGTGKGFDGCAYILIDNSGSMNGRKRMEACKAAAIVEEAFKGIIPFKITAFDSYGTVCHERIKNWSEVEKKNLCWNFALHGRTGYGNEDNYDILITQKELLKRRERKKCLIVLSDGAPADRESTKRAIKETRKKGISVYGIYFEEGNLCDCEYFKDMYEKDYICCPLSELDRELNNLFFKFSRS